MVDLHQDINSVSSFSKCLNEKSNKYKSSLLSFNLYQSLNIALPSMKFSIKEFATCKTSIYVLMEIYLQWSKRLDLTEVYNTMFEAVFMMAPPIFMGSSHSFISFLTGFSNLAERYMGYKEIRKAKEGRRWFASYCTKGRCQNPKIESWFYDRWHLASGQAMNTDNEHLWFFSST